MTKTFPIIKGKINENYFILDDNNFSIFDITKYSFDIIDVENII